ncbi:immunodominant staphylococcal antigen IsaB family protein, partial [Staphylococcus epidermidis]|uniref:immunodominant staphylococcal antigen IsaB family protein n=1 Tax=Staphylococcus epidermidis TaxID=1282 RepID=UPI001C92C27D
MKGYYNYSGYRAHQSNFILHNHFKTSLKPHNFNINPYNITQNQSPKNHKHLYHQTYYAVSNHKPNPLFFSLHPNSLTEKQLFNHYPQPNSTSTSPCPKQYSYKIPNKHLTFYLNQKPYLIKPQIISQYTGGSIKQ